VLIGRPRRRVAGRFGGARSSLSGRVGEFLKFALKLLDVGAHLQKLVSLRERFALLGAGTLRFDQLAFGVGRDLLGQPFQPRELVLQAGDQPGRVGLP